MESAFNDIAENYKEVLKYFDKVNKSEYKDETQKKNIEKLLLVQTLVRNFLRFKSIDGYNFINNFFADYVNLKKEKISVFPKTAL
jgi:hypothetical protein